MTSRLPGLFRQEREERFDDVTEAKLDPRGSLRVPVTEGMVDEAVENVVREQRLAPDLANVLMYNLGKDAVGGVANAYFSSKAADRLARVGVKRHDVTIRYVMTDADVSALVEYAPEFRLKFESSESHDHAVAAACRLVDHRLIMARLPYGTSVTDVGGNPLVHIKSEATNVHVCGPVHDPKDQMRHKLRSMEAAKLARDETKPVRAGMARRFLDKDLNVVCGKRSQECTVKSQVITSIHVYDIDIEDWPLIMDNKGASVVEGCLLFSDAFFDQVSGELPISKVRYEIDVKRDTFEMGFSDSPSWWYKHTWSKYMMYGADQLLCGSGSVYSYKVIERRGDTLFFRIVKLEGALGNRPHFNSRRTPGVPLVRVQGFELNPSTSALATSMVRKEYRFPRALWYEMVSQASEDYERGVMDFSKMYNHYRTVSVRQTINAVLIMGGDPVDSGLLVPLVTHACLAAAAQSTLGQRETRGITESGMRLRGRRQESTLVKWAGALRSILAGAVTKLALPCRLLAGVVDSWSVDAYSEWLLDWEPLVQDIQVPANHLQVAGFGGRKPEHVRSTTEVMREISASSAAVDHFSLVVADQKLRDVFSQAVPQVQVPPVDESPGARKAADDTRSEPPSYVSNADRESIAAIRRAAIVEHMDEIRLGNRALTSVCSRAYRELMVAGKPDVGLLRSRAELYRNPDFWFVSNGVVQESALKIPVADFQHSAVYSALADSDTGEHVRAIYHQEWKSASYDGPIQVHDNVCIADVNFTGWVLTTDDLMVHNGPEIVAAMEESLRLPHDYEIEVQRAPPGSGKTYSIVHSVASDGTDAVMCPVRESIMDTRGEIVKLHSGFPDPKLYVRTLDSYLTNRRTHDKTKALSVRVLRADECYMAHAGKLYAAAALLGASKIMAYGDEKQIPHIPRVQAPKLHVKLRSDVYSDVYTTRRCPATAVAAWGAVYDWKVRSLSQVADAEFDAVASTKGLEVPQGCVMMCMYQADKMLLRQKYAQDLRRIKILTAHEAEGKTYKHVWLHRFDLRRRTDGMSLFDQQPHALVACSRHTHSFKYVRAQTLGDLVDTWIEKSKDPRRVAAALDIATAGRSVEKV